MNELLLSSKNLELFRSLQIIIKMTDSLLPTRSVFLEIMGLVQTGQQSEFACCPTVTFGIICLLLLPRINLSCFKNEHARPSSEGRRPRHRSWLFLSAHLLIGCGQVENRQIVPLPLARSLPLPFASQLRFCELA